jgi:pimeloyl-ACP methyl ester carboxylesterase
MVDSMTEPLAATLAVPGATVYYEIRGTGPALLLIPGGNGDVGPYDRVAAHLADRFTVIAYERRGFSRSPIQVPLEDPARLRADADDATRVLDAVGADAAFVFGSSSGAIVGLDMLARHAGRVRTLVAHEPPLVELVPDAEQVKAVLDDVYATYRRAGVQVAMARFIEQIFGEPGLRRPDLPPGAELPQPVLDMMARMQTNLLFWMEHELRQYPRYLPDVEALRAVSGKLVLAGGEQSRDTFPYRPNLSLAERLGLNVVDFPGDHTGYVIEPTEFAKRLAEILSATR